MTIDEVTPTGEAILISEPNRVALQHGSIATSMAFTRVVSMDHDTFIHQEIKRHRMQDNELAIVRNSAAGFMALLMGDQVLKYDVSEVVDVPIEALAKEIADKNNESMFQTDIQYPLVAIHTKNGTRNITVRVPSTRRRFRLPLAGLDIDIYPPNAWFRIQCDSAGIPREAYIVAVPINALEARNTELCHFPFSNVWLNRGSSKSGAICFGSAKFEVPNGRSNDAALVEQRVSMFFDSNFNDHLLYNTNWDKLLKNVGHIEVPANIDLSKCSKELASFARMALFLREPNAWQRLQYEPVGVSADEFMQGIS